jgi:hypothetical protein
MVGIKQGVLMNYPSAVVPLGQKRIFSFMEFSDKRIMAITKHFAYANNLYSPTILPAIASAARPRA